MLPVHNDATFEKKKKKIEKYPDLASKTQKIPGYFFMFKDFFPPQVKWS